MKRLLNDRKILYFVLSITMVLVFTLTIAYAALNTVLKITGNAEVVASSWDIYLDNAQLVSGSATTNIPTITDKTTASFSTTLTNPGDFYEFTIDVVNNGSIDAMIDSVTKLPELSSDQEKYINYIVEYENGESISTKQLVSADSFVRLNVRVEYRKDIDASDLPNSSTVLDLSFQINYTQADESGTGILNNGKVIFADGDINDIGTIVTIGSERFYTIGTESDNVKLFSMYNLMVGNKVVHDYVYSNFDITGLDNPTGIQDELALGGDNGNVWYGTTAFSDKKYWSANYSDYPYEGSYEVDEWRYVYDNNSLLYNFVENYKLYLENYGIIVEESRLIKHTELSELGCDFYYGKCDSNLSWVYSTSYWTGVAEGDRVWAVKTDGSYVTYGFEYTNQYMYGVRPVIMISKSYF